MTATPPPLGRSVASGLRWGFVDVLVQQVLRFAITVALTRLIAPDDFGLLAMALVFTQLASLLGDLGLGPALVQRAHIEQEHITTAFSVTVITGLLLSLLFVAFSWPVAAFFGESDLQPVLAVLSVTFFVRGISGTPKDLMRRAMLFRPFALTSLVAVSTGGVTGLTLAIAGAGVWALVASVMVEGVVAAIVSTASAWKLGVWKPAFGFDKKAFSEIVRFGAFVSATRVAHYGASNIDNIIVGKVLGASSLGLYNLAYRLMLFPILRVAEVVANVTMPALSSIQHEKERVANAYRTAVQRVALVCFPVSVGTAVLAPSLVPAIFGPRWVAAVACVQILALNGPRLAISRLNGVVFEATGRPQWDLFTVSANFCAYIVAFAVGVQWGIEGVAWGCVLAGYVLLPIEQMLVGKALVTSPILLAKALIPIMLATVVLGIVGLGLHVTLPNMADWITAIVTIVLCAMGYLITLSRLSPDLLKQSIRDLARR